MNGSEEGEREEGVDMVGKEGEVRRGKGEWVRVGRKGD